MLGHHVTLLSQSSVSISVTAIHGSIHFSAQHSHQFRRGLATGGILSELTCRLVHSSTHYTVVSMRIRGKLKRIPATLGQKAGYTLDRSPVFCRETQRWITVHTHIHGQQDSGRKHECPEETNPEYANSAQKGAIQPWGSNPRPSCYEAANRSKYCTTEPSQFHSCLLKTSPSSRDKHQTSLCYVTKHTQITWKWIMTPVWLLTNAAGGLPSKAFLASLGTKSAYRVFLELNFGWKYFGVFRISLYNWVSIIIDKSKSFKYYMWCQVKHWLPNTFHQHIQ